MLVNQRQVHPRQICRVAACQRDQNFGGVRVRLVRRGRWSTPAGNRDLVETPLGHQTEVMSGTGAEARCEPRASFGIASCGYFGVELQNAPRLLPVCNGATMDIANLDNTFDEVCVRRGQRVAIEPNIVF